MIVAEQDFKKQSVLLEAWLALLKEYKDELEKESQGAGERIKELEAC
jgi:hypothetical protein